MNHAQFYDHTKADQAIVISHNNNNNNNNNVSSSPLKINKASHLIKKSSSNSLSTSSSSSSLYNGVAATTSTTTNIIPHHHQQQQQRHPVIIYTHSPKVIHTHPRDFMALVQKLTGLSPGEDISSPPHPPQTTMPQQHLKSEPELDQEDPISGPESCFGNILRIDDHDIDMTNNNMNKKCDLLINDDNECNSVVTDENNGSSCIGGDNSSASCYVTRHPIYDNLPNINDNKDINSEFSNYNYNNNNNLCDSSFFESNLAPFDPNSITNSSDYFYPEFCNSTDSSFYMPGMRNSFSSSSSESIKEFPEL